MSGALMAERNVGAAVPDPEHRARASSPSATSCSPSLRARIRRPSASATHLTEDAILAAPDWSLEQAAEAMIERGFRHLLVVNGAELEGILSMRDIVRCWAPDRGRQARALIQRVEPRRLSRSRGSALDLSPRCVIQRKIDSTVITPPGDDDQAGQDQARAAPA